LGAPKTSAIIGFLAGIRFGYPGGLSGRLAALNQGCHLVHGVARLSLAGRTPRYKAQPVSSRHGPARPHNLFICSTCQGRRVTQHNVNGRGTCVGYPSRKCLIYRKNATSLGSAKLETSTLNVDLFGEKVLWAHDGRAFRSFESTRKPRGDIICSHHSLFQEPFGSRKALPGTEVEISSLGCANARFVGLRAIVERRRSIGSVKGMVVDSQQCVARFHKLIEMRDHSVRS
jgi:hypothetical protein